MQLALQIMITIWLVTSTGIEGWRMSTAARTLQLDPTDANDDRADAQASLLCLNLGAVLFLLICVWMFL